MKKIAFALLFLISTAYRSQSRHVLDSLLTSLKKNPPQDTQFVKNCNTIAYAFSRLNPDSSKLFSDKALTLATKLNYKNGIAGAFNALGIYYHLQASYDSALIYYKKAILIKEKTGDKKGVVSSQNNMGIIFYSQGKYDKALQTFNASLKTQEAMHDTTGIPNTLNYIASVHYFLSNYDKALSFYLKSLDLFIKTKDKHGLSQAYNNLGIIYSELDNLDKAIENYTNSLRLANEVGAKNLVTTCYNNLGTIFQKRKDYVKALDYYEKSLALSRELKITEGIAFNLEKIGQIMEAQNKLDAALAKYKEALAIQEKAGQVYNTASVLNSLGSLYNRLNRNSEAVVCYDRALKAARELGSKKLIADVSFNYAELLKKNKDFKKAYYYLNQYSSIRDTILSDEKNKSMAEMQTRFDTDSKEKEITLLTKNKDIEELKLDDQKENIEKQKVTICASIIGIALALVLVFFVLKSYREKRKTNLLLEEKNFAISSQKQILEEKNTQITHSIEYAKNIQDIILPDDKTFKKQFSDSFVLFIPKDVVSGDFFWLNSSRQEEVCSKQSNKNASQLPTATTDCILVAAIDCVGHGVPGAFMALHSYNLLERIVKENKGISPANILDKLNTEVIKSLHQNNESTSSKHGMDLAMLKIKNGEIEFAGARNSLVIVSPKGEMTEVKADKMFVGGAIGNFTASKVKPEQGSMIYMFTDGYPDQKGGPENKKYFITVFKQLLTSIATKNTTEQKEILQETFTDWKGSHEQMDDVLVIGIKI